MADLRDYAIARDTTAVSSHTGTLPTYAENDLLVWFVVKDTTTGGALTTPAGWTAITFSNSSNVSSTIVRAHAFYKLASASESAPATTSTDTDEFISILKSYKDVDQTTPIHLSNDGFSTSGSARYFAMPAITTTLDDCLIDYFGGLDGVTSPLLQDVHSIGVNECTTALSLVGGHTYKQAAGLINPAPRIDWDSPDNVVALSLAIKSSNTERPLYEKAGTGGFKLYEDTGWTDNPTATTINSITVKGPSDASVSAQDLANVGIHPDREASRVNATSGANSDFSGVRIDFTEGARDMSSDSHLLIHTRRNNPLTDFETVANGGLIVGVEDGSGNWRAWLCGGSDEQLGFLNWRTGVIDISDTSDLLDSAGVFDETDVTAWFHCFRRIGATASVRWYFQKQAYHLSTEIFLGGSSSSPITPDAIGAYFEGKFNLEIKIQGSKALLGVVPMQFGDGTDDVNINLSGSSFEFLAQAKTNFNRYYRHTDNFLGATFYPKTGNVCNVSNMIFASTSAFHWKIHASASASATYTTSGCQIIGPGQTNINVIAHDGMTFSGRDELTKGGGTITNSTIDATNGTQAITITSQTELDDYCANNTFSNNSIAIKVNVSAGVTTLNFDAITFTNNTVGVEYTNDHDIEFTVSNGSNLVIGDVNETGLGTVTLNTAVVVAITAPNLINDTRVQLVDMTNGGTMSSLTRSGSTATATLTAHGFATNNSVYVSGADQSDYNGLFTITVTGVNTFTYTVANSPTTPATGTITARIELDNSVVSGGGGYSFNYTHDGNITARIRACYQQTTTAKMPIQSNVSVTTSGGSLLDSQVDDTEYNSYGIDGSTVTEITADYNNVEIDIDDPDNTMDSRRGVAWFRYITQTEAGIRNFDPEFLTYDPDIRNITIENPGITIENKDGVNPLVITEGIWKNRNGNLIYNTAGGSIFWSIDDRVYQGPETGVSGLTSSESTKLLATATSSEVSDVNTALAVVDANVDAIKAKSDQLTFSKANEIDANIKSVIDESIGGSGIKSDPWGP